MGVIIIFRKTYERNLFREYLHKLISLNGEELILSSGFISEGKFSLLNQKNMLPVLREAVANGLSKVLVIAGKFNLRGNYIGRRSFRQRFDDFINKFHELFENIDIKKIPQERWHAKVSIRISNTVPVAAIIGSSNLTSTAYGIKQGKDNWNKECDIIIWDNNYPEITKKFLEIPHEKEEIIYFKKIDDEFNETKRLQKLLEEIRKAAGKKYG